MVINIINTSANSLPAYETAHAAGMDLKANLQDEVIINPGMRELIPTGLFIELPVGYEAQVRPRSGLALKYGITVLNSPGTIDADYRGEIKVLLINHGNEPFIVRQGDRIAQLIVSAHETVQWHLTNELSASERGAGGYGSTGK
ncbi:MAG: dUTP diphosphatase [Bacteroidia bacterium]|jgi:dUTP pyrophosphatase|nr:dUTP diphosphatase [Bacteroidia bacterium]